MGCASPRAVRVSRVFPLARIPPSSSAIGWAGSSILVGAPFPDLAEGTCADGGGTSSDDGCLFTGLPSESQCEGLGSDFEWEVGVCEYVGNDPASAATDGTATGGVATPTTGAPATSSTGSGPPANTSNATDTGDPSTTATTESGGGLPWLPIGLGLLVLIVVGGFLTELFWPFGGALTGADGDGEGAGQDGVPPPEGPTPLPPMEPSEHACDWGVVYDDGVSRTRLKTPKGTSMGDYVVKIVTAVIDKPDTPTYGSKSEEIARTRGPVQRFASDYGTLGLGHHVTSWYYKYSRRWRSRIRSPPLRCTRR